MEAEREADHGQRLRNHGGQSGSGDSRMPYPDKQEIQNDVDQARSDAEVHGRPGVAHAPEHGSHCVIPEDCDTIIAPPSHSAMIPQVRDQVRLPAMEAAAIPGFPRYCPTTLISAMLYMDWIRLVRKNGTEKRTIFVRMLPRVKP